MLTDPSKRGPKHGPDLRRVIDGMLYVAHTGCQWRYLPAEFGAWTRAWSQFRRRSRDGTWARVLAGLHEVTRVRAGRAEPRPSMLVIDTHLTRGSSNGGVTFHNKGGPYGRTKGAKRVVAVDVTGPIGGVVTPAAASENWCTETLMPHLADLGVLDHLEALLVDRGTSARAARNLEAMYGIEVRRVGWEDKSPEFRPIRQAWRVEVAHGRLFRSRRLAKSFENTTASAFGWPQVACIASLLSALLT